MVGLEERWDHEDAGLGVNFSPDLVQADGDRVFAFGPQTALLDPAVPTPINTVDISAGVDGGVNEVSDAIVDEDACYLGAIGETPLIVQTDRMASEVQGSVQLSSELERVTEMVLQDELLFVAAGASRTSNRGQLVVGDTNTGEQVFEYTWSDNYLDSLAVSDETVFLGVQSTDPVVNAYSIADQEMFRTDQRFGFDGVYNVNVVDGVLYTASTGLVARDAATHEVIYEQELPTIPQLPPVVHDGQVYAMTTAGVRAFDSETGAEQWSVRTTDAVIYPPAFSGRLAFVADISNIIYSIDIETGEILYETERFESSVDDLETIKEQLMTVMDGFRAFTVQYDE
ncbi:PQQ-binding-like beta-propeller repeat protein [Halobellus salinus]|uniref:outer membrane protein assembly factor BamB family protein n=1 Tax=Halobellus salinus TaxID=931585 RepID=UPI00166EA99A|nr:PQQ-binding-like beta-propeller repeat protein [Halobellus salinus]